MPEYITTKTILSKPGGAPDPYFGITYNMNLYRGCQHQCIYCDSRSKVYGIEDFAHIQVKKNALELLGQALRRKKQKGTIGTGSMNDPYMPVEKEEQLTRSALKIIADNRFPVHILTKSNLVVRDTDLLKDIAKVYAAVSFTITACRDELSRITEPAAPPTSERLKAMKMLSDMGLYTGVVLTPVLPFITDKEDNIRKIVELSKDHGAQYVLGWMGMTQREGQREYYYDKLDRHFPGVRKLYQTEFGSNYSCTPKNHEQLSDAFSVAMAKAGLPDRMLFYRE
ncbi:MAG: radical SAM protein, partial [Bacteroidales bacterium]